MEIRTLVAILFDLEGTIVQGIESDQKRLFDFRLKTKEKLIDLGVPQGYIEMLKSTTLMINKAIEYVEKKFEKNKVLFFHQELDDFLRYYQLCWADLSKIFLDTVSTLEELKRRGYRIGIVTNTSREAANRILSMHGITDFFEVVITRNDVKKLKPDPAGILLALKRLNEQDFFFIGDLIHDSTAAKNAGGTSIIMNRNPRKKIAFHADYILTSLKEVPEIIQKKNNYGKN
jgi:HAD superfamily hydrolase (TIGR01549 family)